MKRSDFLSILFATFAIVAVITVTAQPQGGGRGPQGTPEEMAKSMVERMTEQLDLTEDQQSQIYDINVELMGSRGDGNSRPSREEMEAMHEKMDVAIKKVLTKDQIAGYEKMRAERPQGGPRQ